MNSAVNEILDRARDNVLDGERDVDDIILDAFEVEIERSSWVLWELMQEVYNPDDVLNGDFEDDDHYAPLFNYVYREIHREVEDFIEENTWTVHYCDGPTESDEYEDEELTSEEDFLDVIETLTSEEGGWTIVSRYDREVWLAEPEEEEDE